MSRRYGSSRRDDAPLAGRLLWEIGDWGGASEQIGRRWEELGLPLLAAELDKRPNPRGAHAALVSLHEGDVQRRLASFGLKNPDVILVETAGDRHYLRAVDFKWSIETASYEQVRGEVLTALLESAISVLTPLLAVAGVPADLTGAACADGFFAAPPTTVNRQFLTSPENRRQEYPLESHEVIFLTVDARTIFEAFPGWIVAGWLARLDRTERSLSGIDYAERYFRLGTGLLGAVAKLSTPIFESEIDPVDPEVAWDEATEGVRPLTGDAVIRNLRRHMWQRSERIDRLKALYRAPYPFKELAADLATNGIYLPPREDTSVVAADLRERWGDFYRELTQAHRNAINAAGLDLLDAGHSESEALTALEARRAEIDGASRAYAKRRLYEELSR